MGYKRFGSSPDRLKMKRLIPLGSLCTVWCGHLGRFHATPHMIRLLLEADANRKSIILIASSCSWITIRIKILGLRPKRGWPIASSSLIGIR